MKLLTLEKTAEVYGVKLRTLRWWVQGSVAREVSQGGQKRTIPGNGFDKALVRKGRLIFVVAERFEAWLLERAA